MACRGVEVADWTADREVEGSNPDTNIIMVVVRKDIRTLKGSLHQQKKSCNADIGQLNIHEEKT